MRSRPIVFVGDPAVERRRPGGSPIETADRLDVVVATIARERNVPRVLVLDDNSVAAKLTVERLAEEGMNPLHLVDSTGALSAMDELAPRAVVLEVALRGVGGLDLCRRIRAAERWRHVPIVFLTAIADNTTRLGAFEAGGDDLLLKPLDGPELATRLRLRIARARSAQEAWELDPTTGAWTRTRMLQWLMESKEAGLVLVRLRGLRELNASRGLATGDLLLVTAVRSIMLETRTTDIVARWSSTELLVGLPGSSSDDAEQVAERLAKALRSVIRSEAEAPGAGLEVGWSSTGEGSAPEEWLARAFERRDRVTL